VLYVNTLGFIGFLASLAVVIAVMLYGWRLEQRELREAQAANREHYDRIMRFLAMVRDARR
jgi:hypothetical protein